MIPAGETKVIDQEKKTQTDEIFPLRRHESVEDRIMAEIKSTSNAALSNDYKVVSALMKSLSYEVDVFVQTSTGIMAQSSSDENKNSNIVDKLSFLTSLLDANGHQILQEDD